MRTDGWRGAFGDDDYVFKAVRLGASGLLLKDTKPSELRRSIHTIAGDALLSPSITKRVIARFTERRSGPMSTPCADSLASPPVNVPSSVSSPA